VPNSNRRSFIVRAAIAAGVLIGGTARGATAGASASDQQSESKNGFDDYCGNYRVGNDHWLGIDRFILEDSGEPTLLISDYQSGIVRRLFKVSESEFEMGPGFAVHSPAELRVRFDRDVQGHVSSVRLQPTIGAERIHGRDATSLCLWW
jgi:hypothetical protein